MLQCFGGFIKFDNSNLTHPKNRRQRSYGEGSMASLLCIYTKASHGTLPIAPLLDYIWLMLPPQMVPPLSTNNGGTISEGNINHWSF